MSQVHIETHKHDYDFTDFLFGRWAAHVKKIKERAHQLFEERGLAHGNHMEDWLQAEREINSGATCSVETDDNAVTVTLSAPGFSADELKVNIVPGSAFIEGESEQQALTEHGRATTHERIVRAFFYQAPLPEQADIDAASAAFHANELRIVVPLRTQQRSGQRGKAVGATA